MPQVCLVGREDASLQYELLSRETARNALASYDIAEPFANSVAVETVSLGAAVSLLNDLDWYLARFVRTSLVNDESISEKEWLSRGMATAIRDDRIDPSDSRTYLKIYGLETRSTAENAVEPPGTETSSGQNDADRPPGEREPDREGEADGEGDDAGSARPASEAGDDSPPPRLVEPMFVSPTDGDIPEYDLRDVPDTLVVRVTEEEFGSED